MFDLPTCVSCPSVSDEEWIYTVSKNQTFESMLSLDSGSYHFRQQFRAVFQNHISLIPVRLYMTDDRFDNFPLMADKIRIRNTDKGFLVQSNDEAIKQCLYGVFCSFGAQ